VRCIQLASLPNSCEFTVQLCNLLSHVGCLACFSFSFCRAQVALNSNKFIKYHALPTDTLIQLYQANAEHAGVQTVSSEDMSETRRLVSDQQNMLVTVLQMRADAGETKSPAGGHRSSTDEEGYQLASEFLSSLGTAAFGSAPARLGLPADERLIATASCRRDGAFGTLVSLQLLNAPCCTLCRCVTGDAVCLRQYVCTSVVCFEPLEHTGADGERIWQVTLGDLTMARKEQSTAGLGHHTYRSQRRAAELHLSTGSEDGVACFSNFDDIGARDDTLARIRELATGFGASFEGHAVSAPLTS
jgi:hypothetical protein